MANGDIHAAQHYRKDDEHRSGSGGGNPRRFESEDAVLVVAYEEAEFEVEAPNGKPLTIRWGAPTNDGMGNRSSATDTFRTKYRGEDHWSSTLNPRPDHVHAGASLMGAIGRDEDEHQTKRRRDKARAEAAKSPLPALIFTTPTPRPSRGPKRPGQPSVHPRARFEEVHVRGVDLRNGHALIIRADGTKESWAPNKLYRDLDQDERGDIMRLIQADRAADAEVATYDPTSVRDALNEAGVRIDLTMHYDVDKGERWTEVDGERFTGPDQDAIVAVITETMLLRHTPYRYIGRADRNKREPRPLGTDDIESVYYYDEVFVDLDKWAAQIERLDEAARTAQAVRDAFDEVLFDLSLFSGVVAEVAEQEEVEDALAESMPNITARAPEGAGDWDED